MADAAQVNPVAQDVPTAALGQASNQVEVAQIDERKKRAKELVQGLFCNATITGGTINVNIKL